MIMLIWCNPLVQGEHVSGIHGHCTERGTLTGKIMTRDRLPFLKGVQCLFSSWSCHTGLSVYDLQRPFLTLNQSTTYMIWCNCSIVLAPWASNQQVQRLILHLGRNSSHKFITLAQVVPAK